jgi:carboxypeptidase C (cathepsin A)
MSTVLSLLALCSTPTPADSVTWLRTPTPADSITSLPTYGPVHGRQFAGFANATADGVNRLFYWFAECDCGNDDPNTPFLLWLNGGPGASSITGLLIEKLGPQMITSNGTLVDNPDRITKSHHLLIVDNPVGSGFSTSDDQAYVRSESEMRTQFVAALRHFFAQHPEYSANPFWVTGESYAGHYVPNIAWEIAANATEIPLQGVVIGNGMYNMKLQYSSLAEVAFAAGVVNEDVRTQLEERQGACLKMIDSQPATAGDFCENVTVRWLYGADGPAGELFYYDVGLSDGSFFDTLTDRLSSYLNRADVTQALHVPGARWVQADEVGPVGDALLADWTVNSSDVVEELLRRKLKVRMYNGVRDLSSCNHVGNLNCILHMKWDGSNAFASAPSVPWKHNGNVAGYLRVDGDSSSSCATSRLCYATILRTGHLVPTVVPAVYASLLQVLLS